MGEFNVSKSDGSLEQTAGMPDTYPAEQVMMSDGVTSVEEAVDDKLDSKHQIRVIWEGTATFSAGVATLAKTLYGYDVFIPLMGQCVGANSIMIVSLNYLGDTSLGLPFSTGFSGNLAVKVWGIAYDN